MNSETTSQFVRYPWVWYHPLVSLGDSVTHTTKSPTLAVDIRVLREKPQPAMTVFQKMRSEVVCMYQIYHLQSKSEKESTTWSLYLEPIVYEKHTLHSADQSPGHQVSMGVDIKSLLDLS